MSEKCIFLLASLLVIGRFHEAGCKVPVSLIWLAGLPALTNANVSGFIQAFEIKPPIDVNFDLTQSHDRKLARAGVVAHVIGLIGFRNAFTRVLL
jgi:hypothetical protein